MFENVDLLNQTSRHGRLVVSQTPRTHERVFGLLYPSVIKEAVDFAAILRGYTDVT